MNLFQSYCLFASAILFSFGLISHTLRKNPFIRNSLNENPKPTTAFDAFEVKKLPPKLLSDDEMLGYFRKDFECFDTLLTEYITHRLMMKESRYHNSHYIRIHGEPKFVSATEFAEQIIQKIRKLQKDGLL